MEVVVAVAHVDHSRAEAGVDQPGGEDQLPGDREALVVDRAVVERRCAGGDVEVVAGGAGDTVAEGAEPRARRAEAAQGPVQARLVGPVGEAELGRLFAHARGPAAQPTEVLRHVRPDGDGTEGVVVRLLVEPAPDPAATFRRAPAPTVHPDRHRAEVAPIRVGVADPPHDGQLALVPLLAEEGQVRVEPVRPRTVHRQGGRRLDGDAPAAGVVGAVVDGHDRVQTVVAAAHRDDHEDAIGGSEVGVGRGGAVGLLEPPREHARRRGAAPDGQRGVQEAPAAEAARALVDGQQAERIVGVQGGETWVGHAGVQGVDVVHVTRG